MKRAYFPFVCLFSIVFFSCQNATQPKRDGQHADTARKIVINPADMIPKYRDSVQSKPVAEYSIKTDNPLNDWHFTVQLYETHRTFAYRMKLQFEEVRGEDTLELPNLGVEPKPVIRKGPEKYSCIVGFLDKDHQFREYKKVYVVGEQLKVTTLKHYAVATYAR